MSSVDELRRKYQEALDKASYYLDERNALIEQRDRGEISEASYKKKKAAVVAKRRQWTAAAKEYKAALDAAKEEAAAQKKTEAAASSAQDQAAAAASTEYRDEENAAAAQTLYDEAETMLLQYQRQQMTPDRFEEEISSINARLAALDWPPWKPPEPAPEEPPAEPVGEVSIDLDPLLALMGQQGNLQDLVFSSDLAKQLETIVLSGLETQGLTDGLPLEAAKSPVDPAKAAELAKGITLAILGGVSLAGSAVILAEAGSLGQLETPGRVLQMIFGATGADQLAAQLAMIPFQTGVMRGTERYWNSINQAELPGPGDLIRFLVRETTSRARFDQAMREQGFSQEWTDAFWVSHWREVARRDVMDGYHRGVIDEAERDKLLVILDYRPDPRPGISVSDLEIVGSIGKYLIPRVDLRRSFKLGLIDFEELVKRYEWIGYEDDAEQMAFIQSNTAFEAAQNACIREVGNRYAKGQVGRQDFLAAIRYIRGVFSDEELWLIRYEQHRLYLGGGGEPESTSPEETTQESEEIHEPEPPEDE